jgi:NAD-dependent deacetylase
MDERLAELKRLVHGAARIVVFTGAGVSTDSGVPDFRSPGGLWSQFKPVPFKEFLASAETRLLAWQRYFHIHASFGAVEPGVSHRAIAALFQRGPALSVVTQNIDDLHARAGIPRAAIVELHGNGTYATCLSCGLRHEIAWARAFIEAEARAPECASCGGPVKSATIAFGQPMPDAAMRRAREATLGSDLFLAIGSSLQVYPAAGFPVLASESAIPLAIINREPTPLDGAADIVINAEIGETLEALLED